MEYSYIQVLFVISFYCICCNGMPMEPSCSSFDFEKKMLENTVRLEYEYKLSNKKVNDELISLAEEKEMFMNEITDAHERQIADVKNVVATTTAELLEVKTSTKADISEKVKAMDAVFENQQATTQRLSQDLLEMKNETLKALTDKSWSAYISFRASSSTKISVSPGTTIVFPVVSLNHGNGYDPSTGHFTAPVNGTYMFIVRICPRPSYEMVINIVVDGDLYSWGLYFYIGNTCHSHDDVIDLVKGTEVWINCGPGSTPGSYLEHDSKKYQNIFSGYIL